MYQKKIKTSSTHDLCISYFQFSPPTNKNNLKNFNNLLETNLLTLATVLFEKYLLYIPVYKPKETISKNRES